MNPAETSFRVLQAFHLIGILDQGDTIALPGSEAEAALAAPRRQTAKERAKSRTPVRRAFRQLDLLGA